MIAAIATTTIRSSGKSGQPSLRLSQRSASTSAIDAEADSERRAVHRAALGDRQPEAHEEVVVHVADGLQAEQVLQLVEHEQHARAGVKPTITECEM